MRSGNNNAPIGIFDSGFGGLTVAREIARELPHESIIYLGDTARCPYGPRDMNEVDGFVQEIGTWLIDRDIKLMVIACNTATAAGLHHAQASFDVPVLGVVVPGARAAVHATNTRRVGVIATEGTIKLNAYPEAIHHIDAGIKVVSAATPVFVEIVEKVIGEIDPIEAGYDAQTAELFRKPEYIEIARNYLNPLLAEDIDTLVLGCTHFPLLSDLIRHVTGEDVSLISSAEEVAHDVRESLIRKGIMADQNAVPQYHFYTTGDDLTDFKNFSSYVFGMPIDSVDRVVL